MQREPLKDRAIGRWKGILPPLGIPSKALTGKHGPCPMCGGKDRFRFDDKGGRGTWICSQCGAGDGIELVKQFLRIDFKGAASKIEDHIGSSPVLSHGKGQASDDEQQRQEMRSLWSRAKPVTFEDHAGRYLFKRTGLTELPANIRFASDERYTEQGQKSVWLPMMVAKVDPCDAAIEQGERAALHRTYLDGYGGKADVSSPRKMFGAMPTGGAVRLMPPADKLGIAEGIETALAASILYNMPVWAALTADLLQAWQPPASVEMVFIFGDNDASFAGQATAYTLARRLKAKNISTFVELPPVVGQDWNDVLMNRKGKA